MVTATRPPLLVSAWLIDGVRPAPGSFAWLALHEIRLAWRSRSRRSLTRWIGYAMILVWFALGCFLGWILRDLPIPDFPGLRAGMEQMGAPEGFVDVVAAINPIAADDADTPAHWTVTFAVDDADETAAAATKLGGTVVAGPFDAPRTRLAVVEDLVDGYVAAERRLQPQDRHRTSLATEGPLVDVPSEADASMVSRPLRLPGPQQEDGEPSVGMAVAGVELQGLLVAPSGAVGVCVGQ